MKRRGPINELHLNLLGKLFFASVAAWLVGRLTHIKVRGTPDEVRAVANAMMASRRFQDEMSREGATVDSVMQKLGLKQLAAKNFEMALGVPWPI